MKILEVCVCSQCGKQEQYEKGEVRAGGVKFAGWIEARINPGPSCSMFPGTEYHDFCCENCLMNFFESKQK